MIVPEDDVIVYVNFNYENRWDEEDDMEKWALNNCKGFLGTYSNWVKGYPSTIDHVAIKTFYFDNEESAMFFSLRWL